MHVCIYIYYTYTQDYHFMLLLLTQVRLPALPLPGRSKGRAVLVRSLQAAAAVVDCLRSGDVRGELQGNGVEQDP